MSQNILTSSLDPIAAAYLMALPGFSPPSKQHLDLVEPSVFGGSTDEFPSANPSAFEIFEHFGMTGLE
jgi:hypothetical protein